MLPPRDNNYINVENSISNFINNENINENETQNPLLQIINENHNTNPEDNHQNNIKRQPLKSIENIISNKTNINNNTSAKTVIKQSKSFLEENIYQTVIKRQNKNNSFNRFSYTNEEKYSLLKMKKIKSNKFSPYKSTNHLYNKVENNYDVEKNDSKLLYFKLKKNKKIYSLKKAYISHLSFKDENKNSKDFKLFRDCDIGLSDGYKIKTQLEDFDVDSEEEIINSGVKQCLDTIGAAINLMKNKNEEYVGKYLKKFNIC